jgi:hypothetical protein
MKKIFILILLTIFLTGCGIFNLSNFVMPDDLEFLEVIKELDTPEKICAYMEENFIYEAHLFYAPDPYTLWKNKKGDCNDFSMFGIFVANFYGYETYQIIMSFKGIILEHYIGVYKENGKYNYSDLQDYIPINVDTFKEIVLYCADTFKYELKNYKVFDYDNNLIEKGK